MRIRWTPAAADDLEHIKDYLTEIIRILRGLPS
jgi:plasmid stabilization system protein ParE